MKLEGTGSVYTALPGNAVPRTGRFHQDPSCFGVSAPRHGAAGSLKGACRALGSNSEGLLWEKLGIPEHTEGLGRALLDLLLARWHLRKT